MNEKPEIRILESLSGIAPAVWDTLAGTQPGLSHAYLAALEASGCATPDTGWMPRFPTLWQGGELKGAMPLYLKSHSWGEYVFDWAWADAYARHGLDYYPKLVCAVPFTPVAGPRLLAGTTEARAALLSAAIDLAGRLGVSGLHCLFPEEGEAREMENMGMMLRSGLQFHWQNRGYADFEDYLAAMNHDKRKKIRQERRRLKEAGIVFTRMAGRDITEAQWVFFEACYRNTYNEHRATPHLNLDFFLRIGESLPDNLLLVMAHHQGRPIAAALNLFDGGRLYGRYWGTTAYVPGLHFEACYYQGLEFCIERKIAVFEGGAQGGHKLARGFLPVPTRSAHWLAHPQFAMAVDEFLARESRGVALQIGELAEASPFKR